MTTPQDYDYYEVVGDIDRQTDKAWLLEVRTKDGMDRTVKAWFPKRSCELGPHEDEDFKGLLLMVPTWLAKKKGICNLKAQRMDTSMQNGGHREF